jgi:hypothetical protein
LDRLAGGDTNGNDGTVEADSSPLPTDDEEECEGEECFDITRGTFSERTTQSLSTTLPPSKVLATATKERRAEESMGGRQNEVYFDITQHMFPERPRSLSTSSLPMSVGEHSKRSEKPTASQPQEEFFDIFAVVSSFGRGDCNVHETERIVGGRGDVSVR